VVVATVYVTAVAYDNYLKQECPGIMHEIRAKIQQEIASKGIVFPDIASYNAYVDERLRAELDAKGFGLCVS
jgi:hypothetical protein